MNNSDNAVLYFTTDTFELRFYFTKSQNKYSFI